MLHLHVRDEADGHTLDADAYRSAIDAVRRAVGDTLIVQITTEAVGLYGAAAQMAVVREVEPEAASLAIRELVPTGAEEAAAAGFFDWMAERQVVPQYILYSPEDVRRFAELCERGIIPEWARNVLFVLGRYADDHSSRPIDLLEFLAMLEETAVRLTSWSSCAFGAGETACAVASLALGGHARVGFENNVHLPDGRTATANDGLVAAVAAGARVLGRPLTDASTARQIMGGRA